MMLSRIFSYCCAIIIFLLGSDTFAKFLYEKQLYDGSPCKMNNGSLGMCKKIPECRLTRENILARYKTGNALKRCGFDGHIEIVCCPKELIERPRVRPADKACRKWKFAPKHSDCRPDTTYSNFRGVGMRQASGATSVKSANFPYMAVLAYGSDEDFKCNKLSYRCGGSLISLRYILTAAHCTLNQENGVPRWVKMEYGDDDRSINMLTEIDHIIEHPDYRVGRYYHDIALVEIKAAVCSLYFLPVCLQTTAQSKLWIHPSSSIIVIGYGATGPNSEQKSKDLMKSANLTLVTVKSCNESYMDFPQIMHGINSSMICTVDSKKTASDPCEGDSGSPLLIITGNDHSLIAVTSFGQLCHNVVPSVYTSVAAYIDWIESIVWPEIIKSNETFP